MAKHVRKSHQMALPLSFENTKDDWVDRSRRNGGRNSSIENSNKP